MYVPLYQPWLTVFCGVLATIAVITAKNDCTYALSGMVAVTSIILFAVLKLSKQIVFLSTLFVLFFVYAKIRLPSPAAFDISHYTNRAVILVARVVEKPGATAGSSPNKNYLQVQILESLFPKNEKISGQSRLLITPSAQASGQSYELGQTLQIKGQVEPIDGYGQPWLSGLEDLYAKQNIFCQIRAGKQDITVMDMRANNKTETEPITNRLGSFVDEIRQRLTATHIQFLGAKVGGLLASMILGDRAVSLDSGLIDSFKKVGLSHIVAASGFNLTVVTMIAYWLARFICSNKRWVTFIVGVNVIMYAVLAGLSASIVRAAIICMLVLIAKYFNRRLHGLALLSMGLMINIVIDPSVLIEPGGQLSYAATAGIIYGANGMSGIFFKSNDNKFIKLFFASLGVVLMAQLAVLPIQLFHFWQTGLLFLPANLLIDPLVTPVTIAGFLASVMGVINLPGLPLGLTVCGYIDWAASVPLHIIIYITERLAAFDAATLNTGRPLTIAIIFYYTMLAIWLTCLQKSRYLSIASIIFIASLLFLFYQPKLARPVLVIVPQSIVCINQNRLALCFGNNSRLTNKILAYYAARNCSEQAMVLADSSHQKIIVQKTHADYLLVIVERSNQQEFGTMRSTYTVALAGKKNYNEPAVNRLTNQRLSRNQLTSQLKLVEFKVCCPGARFYSVGREGTSFSSSAL